MSKIIENLSTLQIHKLTQAQYDRELAAGRIDNQALYLTPDGDDSNIYIQNEEPTDVSNGAIWIDLSADGKDFLPARGINYWTEEDIAEIKSYVDKSILGGAW